MNVEDLERELTELRPRSISPRLTQRVAEQLAPPPTRAVSRTLGARAFVRRSAVLAAAAALFGLMAWVGWQPASQPTAPAASAMSAPTMLNYQQAFAHSAESLEALLDLHSAHIHLSPASPLKAGDGSAQSAL
jgi:hypothetical protein